MSGFPSEACRAQTLGPHASARRTRARRRRPTPAVVAGEPLPRWPARSTPRRASTRTTRGRCARGWTRGSFDGCWNPPTDPSEPPQTRSPRRSPPAPGSPPTARSACCFRSVTDPARVLPAVRGPDPSPRDARRRRRSNERECIIIPTLTRPLHRARPRRPSLPRSLPSDLPPTPASPRSSSSRATPPPPPRATVPSPSRSPTGWSARTPPTPSASSCDTSSAPTGTPAHKPRSRATPWRAYPREPPRNSSPGFERNPRGRTPPTTPLDDARARFDRRRRVRVRVRVSVRRPRARSRPNSPRFDRVARAERDGDPERRSRRRFETPRRTRARHGTTDPRAPTPKPTLKPAPNRNPSVRLRAEPFARDGWIFARRRSRARLWVPRTRRLRVRCRPSRVVFPANPRGRRLILRSRFPVWGSDRVPRGTPGSGSSPRPARG